MKRILPALLLGFIIVTSFRCQKSNEQTGCFKGRLSKKGMCMNYTITVTGGAIDTSLVEPSWTNPENGVTYTNAFRLGSPCSFPASIKEGDEFYFRIATTRQTDCVVCMAFYPTPAKALFIEVLDSPCP